jgi:hypothetical protein
VNGSIRIGIRQPFTFHYLLFTAYSE